MNNLTNGKLVEALIYARSINDDSLIECLSRLMQWNDNVLVNRPDSKVDIVIGCDFAPYSFNFAQMVDGECRTNGGIIFHGKHDNGGDGSAPTFSVSLTPCNGWQIHT